MRGTVAKRLRRTAQEAHLRAERLEPSSHVKRRLVRAAGALFRRRSDYTKKVDGLVQRGISRSLAELMVPGVERYGETIYNTGLRATYRFLKREYKRSV